MGLIFSASVIRAVSVASPTFSKMFLKSLKSMAKSLHIMEIVANSSKLPASSAKVKALQTDIMLVVRVPVLSEQITLVQPRVSTEGRDLTMAFLAAILLVPRARQVVITAGRPSGMAATARATAILK